MFVYENDNSLNLTLTGNKPVETPDVVIKGYKNGASVIVGDNIYGVKDGEEFEGKAKTFVYQRDNKLAITFKGIAGINTPDVTIDEVEDTYTVVVGTDSVTLVINDGKVTPVTETVTENEPVTPVNEPVKEEEPEVIPDPEDEPEEQIEE